MKTKLKKILSFCAIGLTTASSMGAYLLGVDNANNSFSVFDMTSQTVKYTDTISENVSGLTHAGGNTFYGIVNTGTQTDLYRYDLVLNNDQLSYTSSAATTLVKNNGDKVNPAGGLNYVDGSLLTIKNQATFGKTFSIDPTTGIATELRRYGYKTQVEGLAYDGGTRLYYAETAYGNDTWIGAVDLANDYKDVYFGFNNRLEDETITGLIHTDGMLYGVGNGGLYEFNMITGHSALISSSWGANIDALTTFNVPEPESALAFLLLLGIPRLQRRRAALA